VRLAFVGSFILFFLYKSATPANFLADHITSYNCFFVSTLQRPYIF
jgi:hypothetical protein